MKKGWYQMMALAFAGVGMAYNEKDLYQTDFYSNHNPFPTNPALVIPKGAKLFLFNEFGDITSEYGDFRRTVQRREIDGIPVIARTKEKAKQKFEKLNSNIYSS